MSRSCILLVLLFRAVAASHHIHVLHHEGVKEGDESALDVFLDLNETVLNRDERPCLGDKHPYFLTATAEKKIVCLHNTSLAVTRNDIVQKNNVTVMFKANTFGFEKVTLSLKRTCNASQDEEILLTRDVHVSVLREKEAVDYVFITFVTLIMVIGNINMGCFLEMKDVQNIIKKPTAVILGFVCQYLYMPLASYLIGMLLFDDDDIMISLGFFILGCCPGSTASNSWTLLFHGDVNLSCVMTFMTTVTSFGMMPLWLFTLGRKFFIVGELKIPYVRLLSSLLLFLLPVGIGILIKRYRPKWAEFSKKIIRPYSIFVMLFFITVGIYANLYLIRIMTFNIVAAGAMIAWIGYFFGGLVATIFCLKRDQVIAIAIEVALQNPAIAFFLLKISLPPPADDVATVSPVAQLLVAHMPLWVAFIPYIIYRRVFKKKQDDDDDKEAPSEANDDGAKQKRPFLNFKRHCADKTSTDADDGNAAQHGAEEEKSALSPVANV